MTIYPAIDLRGGRCVRLMQGAFDRETVYGDDPVAVARRWEAEANAREMKERRRATGKSLRDVAGRPPTTKH